MDDAARMRLAIEVYEVAIQETESFEIEVDHIGSDLAYLMAAILKNTSFDAWERNAPFLKILEDNFPMNSPVWGFIKRMNNVTTD
jgi:hypothetical protein